MGICQILIIAGIILILDGLFGFIRRLGIPIPPTYSAPGGFILLMVGIYLTSIGYC